MGSYQMVDVSQVEARNGIFRALTDQLGVAGFRINQLELAAGAEGLEHDHLGDDQEEVYAVVAGDCNFWGPGVVSVLPGWRRAFRGRTFPAVHPHSHIDHVLVRDNVSVVWGEVLGETPSDHLGVDALGFAALSDIPRWMFDSVSRARWNCSSSSVSCGSRRR